MKEWKNPFAEFPKTLAYNSSLDMAFTIKGTEPFQDWRKKWENDILEAYRLSHLFTELMEEMIKLGVIDKE